MHGYARGFKGGNLGCAVGRFERGVGRRDYLGVLMDRYGKKGTYQAQSGSDWLESSLPLEENIRLQNLERKRYGEIVVR
jgi:hypothetical protein